MAKFAFQEASLKRCFFSLRYYVWRDEKHTSVTSSNLRSLVCMVEGVHDGHNE